MKKRGMANSMLIAAEIVGAALVSFLLITTATKWADSETPYKEYLSKDISLVIESLMASPGNVKINYSSDVSGYIIDIQQNSVAVYSNNPEDGMQSFFIPSSNIKMNNIKLENPKAIQFVKINDEIIINEKVKENLELVDCCEETGYYKTNVKMLVDLKQQKEYNELCSIANSFMLNIGNKKFVDSLISTRKLYDKTADDEISQINCMDDSYSIPEEKADVILSIRAGNDESNSIKAFVLSGSKNEQESKRLACLIINSILKSSIGEDIAGASVVPVNLSIDGYDFPFELISSYAEEQQNFENVFVLLEIGNKKDNMLISEIGEMIARGFSDYEK